MKPDIDGPARTVLPSIALASTIAMCALWGCAVQSSRQRPIFETPMPGGSARLEIDDELLVLRVVDDREPSASVLEFHVLPEIDSILSKAAVPAATSFSARIAASTEPWIGLLFERNSQLGGDVLEVHADRREVDFLLRVHVPHNQQAIGIEVEYSPAVPLDICRATHTILIHNLSPSNTYWADRGAEESPVAIPAGRAEIALVTDSGRSIGLASLPEWDQGVLERRFRFQRQEGTARLELVTTMGMREENDASYRLVLSYPSRPSPQVGAAESVERSGGHPPG